MGRGRSGVGRLMRLLGPRDLLKGSPATPEAYRALVQRQAQRVGRELVDHPGTLHAYVNRGRWLADCPYCNNGILIHPEWSEAVCPGRGCYRVFSSIEIPADWGAIEAELVKRPMLNQHWLCAAQRTKWFGNGMALPAETVDELIAETQAHREGGEP